jgi:hypothetical protein
LTVRSARAVDGDSTSIASSKVRISVQRLGRCPARAGPRTHPAARASRGPTRCPRATWQRGQFSGLRSMPEAPRRTLPPHPDDRSLGPGSRAARRPRPRNGCRLPAARARARRSSTPAFQAYP